MITESSIWTSARISRPCSSGKLRKSLPSNSAVRNRMVEAASVVIRYGETVLYAAGLYGIHTS